MTRTVKTAVVVMVVVSLMGVASAIGQSADHVLKQTKSRQEQVLRKNLKKTFPSKNAPGGPGLWHYENLALAAYSLNEKTAKADSKGSFAGNSMVQILH